MESHSEERLGPDGSGAPVARVPRQVAIGAGAAGVICALGLLFGATFG